MYLIRLVFFFDRFRAADFWLSFASVALGDFLPFVNFFEYVGDHRRGSRAAVHFAADIAFVESSERILRLVGWRESREPCRRALFVFRSSLCGPGFSGDFNIIETCLMSGAATAIHHVDHPYAQLLPRFS